MLRLQDELHAVQAMHRWENESVDEGLLRVVYDREVVLTVPLTQTAQAVQGKEEEGRVEFRNEKEGDEVMRGLKEVFGSAVRVLKVRGLGVSRVSTFCSSFGPSSIPPDGTGEMCHF